MEANELVSGERRQSESPARTIESMGSTVASIETIVDRNEELTNVRVDGCTNITSLNNKNRSLSNSQTSISQKDERSVGDPNQQQDSLSHIYSSPVYLTTTEKPSEVVPENEMPKLITHAEFEKQQLTPPKVPFTAKSSTATLDSKISKKQRFPPEFIKIKGDSVQDLKVGPRSSVLNRITLGIAQLLLSVALVALGALLVVRGASLAAIGSGIWTGGIAAVTGALGVINMRKVQTGFLALSLVCIATSTLALAISGVGLTRDINKLEEKTVPIKLSSERITAAYWLVFTLGLHFAVSVISVYKAASRLCSRSINDESTQDINNQGLPVDHETVEEYIKTMSVSSGSNNLMKKDHLVSQLMYPSPKNGTIKDSQAPRSIILIPASLGSALLPSGQQPMMRPPPLGVLPPYPMLFHPPGMGLPPVPMVYRGGMTLPSKRPGRHSYGSQRSQMAPVRNHRHHQHPHQYPQPPACFAEINGRHTKSHCRTCTNDSSAAAAAAARQQRRKSDTDADNRKAFTYTGLDRQIADSFLARQEQTNGSHIDYTSSSESGRNECHDVAM